MTSVLRPAIARFDNKSSELLDKWKTEIYSFCGYPSEGWTSIQKKKLEL